MLIMAGPWHQFHVDESCPHGQWNGGKNPFWHLPDAEPWGVVIQHSTAGPEVFSRLPCTNWAQTNIAKPSTGVQCCSRNIDRLYTLIVTIFGHSLIFKWNFNKNPPRLAFFSHQPGRFSDQIGVGSQVVRPPKVHSHARKQATRKRPFGKWKTSTNWPPILGFAW